MSFPIEPAGNSSVHIIDGSDRQLLNLPSILIGAGLTTAVISPGQGLSDTLDDQEATSPTIKHPSFIQTFTLKGITNHLSLNTHVWTGFPTAINPETRKSWPKQWLEIILGERQSLQDQQWTVQDELNQQIIAEAPT